MTQTQIQIVNEATATIAAHYAQKLIEKGVTPTAEQLKEIIAQNWSKIADEIARLTAKTEELLAA